MLRREALKGLPEEVGAPLADRADGDPVSATVTWEGGQTDTNDRGLATVPEGVELRVSAEGYEPALLVSDSTRVVVWLRQGAPPLEVVVEGREGSRAWSAAGQYAAGAIREGRFQPPVERRRGRLCVRADWDEVQLTSA